MVGKGKLTVFEGSSIFSMDFNYTTYRKQLQDLSADEFQQPAL